MTRSRPRPGPANAESPNPTQAVLQARHAGLARAKQIWANWTELQLAFGLRETAEPETLVISISRLIHALRAVDQEDVLDRLHSKSPFLPTTWEVISRLRSKEPFEASFKTAIKAIEKERPTPYWNSLWEELTAYFWMRVQNSLPSKESVEAAAHRFHDEALQLEAGVVPTMLTDLAKPPVASRPSPAPSEPVFAPDHSWLCAQGVTYRFTTPLQRAVIGALAESWLQSGCQDGCGLQIEALREKAGSAANDLRIAKVFAGNSALNAVLRSEARGHWALYLNALPG